MGREVRRVPPDWQHPKDSDGRYIPLFEGRDYELHLEGWKQAVEENGPDPDEPEPDQSDYMPVWPAEQATHLMMYESTSEGTPLSPAFAMAEDLARWLADNNASAFAGMTATYDDWLATIRAAGCVSAVAVNGRLISGPASSNMK